jgi:Aerotolerance regulator N-terminal
MGVLLLNPIAFAALAAIAAPIVVHLLLRRRATRLPFPSLRFIPPSSAAAVRLRSIADWPLLLVRVAIIGVAAFALARPLFVTPARRAGWEGRVARAVVVDVSASAAAGDGPARARRAADSETQPAFRSRVFDAVDLSSGILEGLRWLSGAPPARRELVLISDFQLGSVDEAALARIPESYGVRFVQIVPEGGANSVAPNLTVEVRARDRDVRAVRAALEAAGQRPRVAPVNDKAAASVVVVARGGSAPPNVGPIQGAWMASVAAALPGVSHGAVDDRTMVVMLDKPADSFELPLALRAIRRAFFEPRAWQELEPDHVAAETLVKWSRPPGPIDERAAAHADEDDGRWVWLAALGLIGVETWLRRRLDARVATPRSVESVRAA